MRKAAIVCCLVLGGCAFDGADPADGTGLDPTPGNGGTIPAGPGAVSGRIITSEMNGFLGAGLLPSTVVLTAESPCFPARTGRAIFTDATGAFAFDNVAAGTYTLALYRAATVRGAGIVEAEIITRTIDINSQAASLGTITLPPKLQVSSPAKGQLAWVVPPTFTQKVFRLDDHDACKTGTVIPLTVSTLDVKGMDAVKIVVEDLVTHQMAIRLR
jgi:hypothetical protein